MVPKDPLNRGHLLVRVVKVLVLQLGLVKISLIKRIFESKLKVTKNKVIFKSQSTPKLKLKKNKKSETVQIPEQLDLFQKYSCFIFSSLFVDLGTLFVYYLLCYP